MSRKALSILASSLACSALTLSVAQIASAAPKWYECAQVNEGGDWSNEACTTESAGKGSFERVAITPINFTSTSGQAKLEAGSNIITCKSGESSGYFLEPSALKHVTLKLLGCKGEEQSKKSTCGVKSISPAGSEEELVFHTLKGELGKVAKSEAESGVGLLLVPESGPDVELEGSCLSTKKSLIEGGEIFEVSPVSKVSTSPRFLATISSKKDKIRKFEGGALESFKAFGLSEAPFSETDEVKPEDSEVGLAVGEQVGSRPYRAIFLWRISGTPLGAGLTKPIETFGIVGSAIAFKGKVGAGATNFEVRCTGAGTEPLPAPVIKGGANGGMPGEGIMQLKFRGCTIPEPANCTLTATTAVAEAVELLIGEGLGLSAGRLVLRLKQVADATPFVSFSTAAGGMCAIPNTTLAFEGNGVLAEARTPAQSLATQEFLFEPSTRTDVQLYSTTNASGYTQAPTGFTIGSGAVPGTLTGIFAFKTESMEPFGLY
jgi:hypothetical protein